MTQARTMIGACDYSIATLENIKSAMMDYGHPQKHINWAIGGIIITLTSHLLRTCESVFVESVRIQEGDAKNDLSKIQAEFNQFMDRMINNE